MPDSPPRQTFRIAIREFPVKCDALSFDIAKLAHPANELTERVRIQRSGTVAYGEYADPPDFALLSISAERRCSHTHANCNDQSATFVQCIPSISVFS